MYLQAIDYSKDIVSGGQPITFEDKIANIDALSNELMREWSSYLRERERARFLINAMPSSKQKSVLIDRYVNGHTWEKVAALIGCSVQNIHNIHKRAIRNFEEIFKKVDSI